MNTCPNCGYCPHCGRRNPPHFQPYQVPYAGLPQVGGANGGLQGGWQSGLAGLQQQLENTKGESNV